jgi:hypothetical protein
VCSSDLRNNKRKDRGIWKKFNKTEPEELEDYEKETDDVEDLETYDLENDEELDKEGLNEKINHIDRPLDDDDNDEISTEEARAAGKFFGFVRGMYDKATDKWNDKKLAKQEAYEEFLQQKPELMENYKDQLVQKNKDNLIAELERDLNRDPNNNRWKEAYSQLSTGLGSVASLIPNRQPSSALFGISGFNRPENVTGISGSIFGSFPSSNNPNVMQKINQFSGFNNQSNQISQPQPRMINENVQLRNLQPQTPESLQEPNVTGSQVPKYSAAPKNDPNSVYARIIKIDKYGKKRSYLRKMRVPDSRQPSQPQQVNVNQMQQQNINKNQMQTQQPNINRNMFYNPDNVRQNLESSQQPSVNTFNPDAYLGMKPNFNPGNIIDIKPKSITNERVKKINPKFLGFKN